MKILRYALLSLICFVPLTALSSKYKYKDAPTDSYIGIVLFDKDDINGKVEEPTVIEQSDGYFILGYTYNYFQEKNKDEYKLVLHIPEIDYSNRTNYTKIKDWIEWIEDREGIDICENITTVPNERNPYTFKDALLTFKNAIISTDQWELYEDEENEHNVKIIFIGIDKISTETTDNQL